VEGPDELDAAWFEGIVTVGVTAGASTPDYSIDVVERRIQELAPA
jgi:4-hydroxy-3-methylbut-2-enyl diphosphate reductase